MLIGKLTVPCLSVSLSPTMQPQRMLQSILESNGRFLTSLQGQHLCMLTNLLAYHGTNYGVSLPDGGHYCRVFLALAMLEAHSF